MINVNGLTKRYHSVKAVDDLSIEINNGEIMGFAGLNGAGKTTTIRAIAGIIFPTSGKITVDNYDIVKNKVEASKHIGWVPELPNFEPNAKPLALLSYYAGFYGIKSRDAKIKGEELLKRFNIYQYKDRKLKSYSQGMKKRFSLAASMIGNPDNYLFDETLNGLDPQGVKDVRDLMIELKNSGKSVFLSSHILSELQNIADRIAIIKKGSIIKILNRNELSSLGNLSIKIGIKNPDKNVPDVLKSFGDVLFKDNHYYISIKNLDDDSTSEINSILVRSGYNVSSINTESEGLEEYFLNVVK